jgi:hypothetical protein
MSPILSPVKEEPEFKDIHAGKIPYIQDLLEKQTRQVERQQEQTNDYRDRQMDKMMD